MSQWTPVVIAPLCLWRTRRTARRKVVLNRQTSALQRIGKIRLVTCATNSALRAELLWPAPLMCLVKCLVWQGWRYKQQAAKTRPHAVRRGRAGLVLMFFRSHSDAVPSRCFGSVRACIDLWSCGIGVADRIVMAAWLLHRTCVEDARARNIAFFMVNWLERAEGQLLCEAGVGAG